MTLLERLREAPSSKALASSDLPDACFGGGFACGLLIGLEVTKP